MKRTVIMAIFSFLILGSGFSQQVVFLNEASFKANVWDYDKNSEWKFIGNKPMIIDFYADWCQPCKMIAPHLTALQSEYGSKLQIYKIDTDKNPALASLFKIRSIPTLFYIPADGNYQQIVGYRDKNALEQLIKTVLKVEK